MPESRRMPQVAQVEDCDSDDSSVKPGTRVQARRRASSVKPPNSRYTASDSGYSSHHGVAQTQHAVASSSRVKPVVHNPSSQARPPRASSVSRPTNLDRRYTLPERQPPKAAQQTTPQTSQQQIPQQLAQQYATWAAQYPDAARQHQHQLRAHAAAAQGQPAPIAANPRPQTHSTSRSSRPISIHGYAIPSATNTTRYGLPPSPASAAYHNYASAWENYRVAYQQNYGQPPAYQYTPPSAYLSPESQIQAGYPAQPPVATSPTVPAYNAAPPLQRNPSTFSARRCSTSVSGMARETSRPRMAARPQSVQHFSARQRSGTQMPGTFPGEESAVSESECSSEASHSLDSEEEYKRDKEKSRRRDSRIMPPPPVPVSRRPSIHARKTEPPIALSRSLRHKSHHTPRSDTAVEYTSSSEQFDSDRARVGRSRTESSYSGRSRRESISTNASSGRTKATSVSTGSGLQKVILEDDRGRRRTAYISPEQQSYLKHQYERRRREDQEKQETIERYQQDVGGPRQDLTVDNVKGLRRTSGSHVSRGSHKSSSFKTSRSEGIKIQAGDTVLHVYGEASVEMMPGENGGPAVIKIGSGMASSTKDSAYHGSSKGSSSRTGRRPLELPQDGYESGH